MKAWRRKHPDRARESDRRRKARQREREKRGSQEDMLEASLPAVADGPDPVDELADWAKATLRVPAGHPDAGKPMELPGFAADFLRDAMRNMESVLSVARKNGKSAICAVLILGHLVGPLRRDGWRCGIASVDKLKAGELRRQIQEISEASGLGASQGLRFLRTPTPGRIEGPNNSSVDILAARESSGHASGFDLALVDEIGLLEERDRAFINGMRTSIGSRGGRFVAISIQGGGPFVPEMIERAKTTGFAAHVYAADEGCDLEDEEQWRKANPGLGSIKSFSYLRGRIRSAILTPADASDVAAHDLNLRASPSREGLIQMQDWAKCVVDDEADLPARTGRCYLGVDLGGSVSLTAATGLWIDEATGLARVECWGAIPDRPSLEERGLADGVGRNFYRRMHERGEISLHSGRIANVATFLRDVAARLDGSKVVFGADRYRKSEAAQALEDAGVAGQWEIVWRGIGAMSIAHGSADVRSLQRLVIGGRIRTLPNLFLESCLSASILKRDSLGNPAIDKRSAVSRIDAASALAISAGLSDLYRSRARPRRRLIVQEACQ